MTRSDHLVARLRDVGFCGWDTQQEAADEIERLREQLADAHDMIDNLTDHIYRMHRIIQEARNDPS